MKIDSLRQFVTLQQALLKEKAALQARLAQIEQALGGSVAATAPASVPTPAPAAPARKGLPRVKNPMSLKAAVVQVTSVKPLTKPEILAAIHKLGYRFTGKNPTNSLNVALYTGKQFKNDGGKFSPAKK